MAQESTQEFATRLNLAVEGHPLAPPTPHGRQAWLREKLIKETGLTVSANTMSRWFNGAAKPREDNVRKLAKVLQVDEVWLALGRKPIPPKERVEVQASARGAVAALAGILEMSGARVAFPDDPGEAADLYVSLPDGASFSAVVVSPREVDGTMSFVVPEPTGGAKVFGVFLPEKSAGHTACLSVIDLTDLPRQMFGGFSIVSIDRRPRGKFHVEGVKGMVAEVASVADLPG